MFKIKDTPVDIDYVYVAPDGSQSVLINGLWFGFIPHKPDHFDVSKGTLKLIGYDDA
ncbi:TPA: hypothetical protein M2Q89_000711 [Escherichia coli]|nr:hypothetical protein [Escherichia coli]